jgi:hypothetical protein
LWALRGGQATPLPPSFSGDLWNVEVTRNLLPQNIDYKDFVCKFFGMKILHGAGPNAKAASGFCRLSQPSRSLFDPSISIVGN